MDIISTNKLILYYFNETELTDSVVVQQAIDYDYQTAESYQEITDTFEHLDSMMYEPAKSTIDKIMSYSRSIAG